MSPYDLVGIVHQKRRRDPLPGTPSLWTLSSTSPKGDFALEHLARGLGRRLVRPGTLGELVDHRLHIVAIAFELGVLLLGDLTVGLRRRLELLHLSEGSLKRGGIRFGHLATLEQFLNLLFVRRSAAGGRTLSTCGSTGS